jgi:hypothetical protein
MSKFIISNIVSCMPMIFKLFCFKMSADKYTIIGPLCVAYNESFSEIFTPSPTPQKIVVKLHSIILCFQSNG